MTRTDTLRYNQLFGFPAESPREGEYVVAWKAPIMKALAFNYYPSEAAAIAVWGDAVRSAKR